MSSEVLTGATLARLLGQVPAAPLRQADLDAAALVERLLDGGLTWAEALTQDAAGAVETVAQSNEGCTTEGGRLCQRLSLPAVAAAVAAW